MYVLKHMYYRVSVVYHMSILMLAFFFETVLLEKRAFRVPFFFWLTNAEIDKGVAINIMSRRGA